MGKSSTVTKLDRIEQLIGLLKSGEGFTAKSLAERLHISLRTLMRDIHTLREKGYPIESEQGRGGGIRLYPRWGVGKLALNYREVIDLLLAINILEQLNSPLFLNHLGAVKNKLSATFPDAQRQHILAIRERILIGTVASDYVNNSYQPTQPSELSDCILESFIERQYVAIRYQREDGQISERTVEVHYLYLNWPVWYLLCYDHYREADRIFRIDRILTATKNSERFQLKPKSFLSWDIEKYATQI